MPKPKLLVVEDDILLARSIAHCTGKQYEVTLAYDGQEAIELLSKNTYDIVLSDVQLPSASGIDILKVIRTYDLDVPVILMTGAPNYETAVQAIEYGAYKYLEKPISLDILEPTLDTATRVGRLARLKREALAISGDCLKEGDRASLLVAFERALQSMRLAFQPIVNANSKEPYAYEALLRTHDAAFSNPETLLEAAERLDAMPELSRRVRQLAAVAIKDLPENVYMFVNIHASDLNDQVLYTSCPLIAHANRIVFEITERASINSAHNLLKNIQSLRSLGFRLAIDDLGAGYAGLSMLTSVEPEVVKIDMSLVRGVETSAVKQQVIESLITLCRDMNMLVVIEGVETNAELAVLMDLGCDLVQGYLFGKPKPEFT